jgi:quinol monooxygenase YgiN
MNERNGEIISTAEIKALPEKRRELCLTISSLLGRIRSEQGCRSYKFYGEAEDQNSFTLIGEWETLDAWNRHLRSENFAVLLGSLKLLSARSKVNFKLLSHVARIEGVTRVRCEPLRRRSPRSFIN